MTSAKYMALALSEKKKIVKSIIRAANKEQRDMVERYRSMKRSKKCPA